MRKALPLKISVSGVRGIVGESLTPQIAARFAAAFGTYLGPGKIMIGQDSRSSGLMLKKAVISSLLATGCQPVEVGILPIPTILFLTKEKQMAGAVVITASHNPLEWNGLKFIGPEGLYLRASQVEEFLDIFHQGEFTFVPAERIKPIIQEKNAGELHLQKILSKLKVEAIRKRKFRVVADCANGAGATLMPQFLKELGCQVLLLNTEFTGSFAHQSEPVAENLSALCQQVRHFKADLGLAQDADADRLALVDETGKAPGEDFTLTLAVDQVLKKKKGPIVVNLSASMVIDDIAKKYHVPIFRTKIGESNVVEKMLEIMAVIGGEGNGGVIWQAVHPSRDSFVATGLVLEYMAESGKTLSQLVQSFPRYFMVKDKLPCPSELAFQVMTELRRRHDKETISTVDGLKIIWPNSWIHLRSSNTEPIIRLIAESRSAAITRKIIESYKQELLKIMKKLS